MLMQMNDETKEILLKYAQEREAEKERLEKAFTDWLLSDDKNIARIARKFAVNRGTLYKRIQKALQKVSEEEEESNRS